MGYRVLVGIFPQGCIDCDIVLCAVFTVIKKNIIAQAYRVRCIECDAVIAILASLRHFDQCSGKETRY